MPRARPFNSLQGGQPPTWVGLSFFEGTLFGAGCKGKRVPICGLGPCCLFIAFHPLVDRWRLWRTQLSGQKPGVVAERVIDEPLGRIEVSLLEAARQQGLAAAAALLGRGT